MFVDFLSPAGLISIAISSVLISLIPAFVIKLLMGAFFFATVRYLMVLLGLAVSAILIMFALGAYEALSGTRYDMMSDLQIVLWTVGGFIFQAICLKVIATDPRMTMISIWKWAAVLILQYVVYALLGLIFLFVA